MNSEISADEMLDLTENEKTELADMLLFGWSDPMANEVFRKW